MRSLSPNRSLQGMVVAAICVVAAIVLWSDRMAPLPSKPTNPAPSNSPSHIYPIMKAADLDPSAVHFVAVGDSYTYCQGASEQQAWPTLLTRDLAARGVKVQLAGNLGVDGITSAGTILRELPTYDILQPTFATLMIGVNDTYRSVSVPQFRVNVKALLDHMQAMLPDKSRLIVITIPDLSASPVGFHFAGINNAAGKLPQFNTVIEQEAKARRLPVIDVFPLTRQMRRDRSLIASDGLHPSAKEYAIWEKSILPVALKMLKPPGKASK